MSECKKCGTSTFGPLCAYCKGELSPFEREPVRVTTYMQDIHSESVCTVSKADYDKLKGENDQLWRDVERVRAQLAAENAELKWKAKESELAMMEAQQNEDFANATLDALRDLCGPNRTISNSTCMKMVDILYPQPAALAEEKTNG